MAEKKGVWKRLNEFIYRNFKLGLEYLKEVRNYVWFSLALFFGLGVFGFLFPVFFEVQILNLIKELLEQTKGLGAFGLIRFIFMNNLKSSFFALALGIFFGLVPFVVLLVNGYVLGFVASKSVAVEGVSVLWRLLPHGIFEIPAVMISIGLGIRLGLFLFIFKGENKKKEFFCWLLNSLRVFVFIVIPLLVIAAIIEGFLIWAMG